MSGSSDGAPPDVDRRLPQGSGHHRTSFGRRADDYDPRTNITTKVLVGVVAVVNALYLVGETLLNQPC